MTDTATPTAAAVRRLEYRKRLGVADLVAMTLERAGEKSHDRGKRGRNGGYYVGLGRSRWDGTVSEYFVECTDPDLLDEGALDRYAAALGAAGWFVETPGPEDTVVFVEVIGDTLLERAPTWLCQPWEELRELAAMPGWASGPWR